MRPALKGLLKPAWPFVLIVLAPLTSNGQPIVRAGGCDSNRDLRPGLDPFDIIGGKPQLKDLWSTLGIPAQLQPISRFGTGTEEIDCTEGCEARIVSQDYFLQEDGRDSVVRICNHFETACRFLVLHKSSAGWRLVDYLDSPVEKYEAPTAWIESAQDRRWLVKRGYGGSGTGVSLTGADWFEFRCGALQPVLSVPSRGHDLNARPARYFSTRFKGFHELQGRESLEFAYVVLFQDYENYHQLWQEERTVVFSRTDANAVFKFDPAASNISDAFQEKVFNFDSMDHNDFVEFAYDRLLRIARDPADRRSGWLRRFLSETPPTTKAKTLNALLGEQKRSPQSGKPRP